MSNEALALLDVFQTNLGASRAKCDASGKLLWDRIEAVKIATIDAQLYAASLEAAVMEVANNERKPAKLPIEPMVRLIHFARTSSVKNAAARPPEVDAEAAIAAGFKNHKYAQGTKECVAFYRGACWQLEQIARGVALPLEGRDG